MNEKKKTKELALKNEIKKKNIKHKNLTNAKKRKIY